VEKPITATLLWRFFFLERSLFNEERSLYGRAAAIVVSDTPVSADNAMAWDLRIKIIRHDGADRTRGSGIAGLFRDLAVTHRFAFFDLGNYGAYSFGKCGIIFLACIF
jgi:hypothetical protein